MEQRCAKSVARQRAATALFFGVLGPLNHMLPGKGTATMYVGDQNHSHQGKGPLDVGLQLRLPALSIGFIGILVRNEVVSSCSCGLRVPQQFVLSAGTSSSIAMPSGRMAVTAGNQPDSCYVDANKAHNIVLRLSQLSFLEICSDLVQLACGRARLPARGLDTPLRGPCARLQYFGRSEPHRLYLSRLRRDPRAMGHLLDWRSKHALVAMSGEYSYPRKIRSVNKPKPRT